MAKKVLVIDDETDMVNLLKSRLEANHYDVAFAFDGDDGLLKAKKERPDLILLDVMMPNVDGYSFVLEIKKMEGLKNTPIIVLTAKDEMQDIFKMEGVQDYIVKPFQSEDLMGRIKKILGE